MSPESYTPKGPDSGEKGSPIRLIKDSEGLLLGPMNARSLGLI